MIRHYHENKGDETIWHDGPLSDCPDTVWDDWIVLEDGRQVRFARGMSVTLPPNETMRLRYISNVDLA